MRWLLTRPVAAFAVGGLAWGVPLVVDSGGIESYLAALGTQAGEDFAWVNMLWLEPTPRRLAFALYETFVLPWGSDALAAVIAIAAVIGACVAFVRDRRALALLLVAFGPYTAFHLLFQETLTVRYALPTLVPVVGWLPGARFRRTVRALLAVPLVAAALIVSVPVGTAYGREAHPAFRAIDAAMAAGAHRAARRGVFALQPLARAPGDIRCRRQSSRGGSMSGWVRPPTGEKAARSRSGFSPILADPTWH